MRLVIDIAIAIVVATAIDFGNAIFLSVHDSWLAHASNVSWLILAFYVPLLCVTPGLVVWQLVSRRGQALQSAGGR